MTHHHGKSPAERKTILLIDDEPLFRLLMEEYLQNHRVLSFENGAAAIAWLEKNRHARVDVVFSDFNMPGLNGVETCMNIHKLTPHAKLVLMSATIQVEELARKHSFDAWLAKPFSETALERILDGFQRDAD